MIYKVVISDKAERQLFRVPQRIARKLFAWVETVKEIGLEETRKISSFHDEPLSGDRKGERSIRLNIHYRAIYVIKSEGFIEFVSVEEVTKHDY